jgi:[ribosomal protein S5]-alanine N-acetyltransferase
VDPGADPVRPPAPPGRKSLTPRVTLTRLIAPQDALELGALTTANRDFLAPWEPLRPESYFSPEGQLVAIEDSLDRHARGTTLPHVIVEPDSGRIAGRITLNGIVRGPFLSCSVGYWVGQASNGRGLASAAVREIVGVAFGQLGLHRVQAETLLHNTGSQRVLEHNGFTPIGMAPAFLCIQGKWQDHLLFQVLNPAIS